MKNNPLKKGRVVLFYQPEEENGQGAKRSIQRLKELNLYPDFAFAIHNMPKHPMGSTILAKYTFASASKGVVIKLIGKESHAAFPEKGINPALATSEIIKGLYELSNSTIFNDFVLLTIIHVRIGEIAFGTSPGYAEIMVTLRAFDDKDMTLLHQKVIEICRSIGITHSLAIETATTDDFPSAVCDPELTNVVETLSKLNNREVVVLNQPNRWSEDFSHFTSNGSSIIFGLGVGEDVSDLHSPDYDFPDNAIEHGLSLLDSIITHYLR